MKTIYKKDIQAMKKTFELFPWERKITEVISDSLNAATPSTAIEAYLRDYPAKTSNWEAAAVSAIIVYTGAKVQKECSEAKGRFNETVQEIARRLNCDATLIKRWLVALGEHHEMNDRHWNWGRFSTHLKCDSWDNILEIA